MVQDKLRYICTGQSGNTWYRTNWDIFVQGRVVILGTGQTGLYLYRSDQESFAQDKLGLYLKFGSIYTGQIEISHICTCTDLGIVDTEQMENYCTGQIQIYW